MVVVHQFCDIEKEKYKWDNQGKQIINEGIEDEIKDWEGRRLLFFNNIQ